MVSFHGDQLNNSNAEVSFASSNANSTSRSAHIAEMNEIYLDEELIESLAMTNELIANVREKKDAMYRDVSTHVMQEPV